ncbi:hypothetical protein G6F56_005510 [Rhizopus delemar]|nr:hypothetical protein G6F56_005510 [Rhizopus delemar]
MIPAIGEALLHIIYLQRDLSRSLRHNHHNWEKICPLSSTSLEELQLGKKFVTVKNGLPIHKIQLNNQKTTVYVDTSDTGWGVVSTSIKALGYWTEEECETSINVRELKTIWFALLFHAEKFHDSTIQILSDNRTANKYDAKAGGTSSVLLQEVAIKIQELCNKYNI